MTFGKESTGVPMIITVRIADKCLVGTREELVLHVHVLFSNTLFLVMRSGGFYTGHKKQISLWGNAVIGKRLQIVPKLA